MLYIISILFCLTITTLSYAMEEPISAKSFSQEIKYQMSISYNLLSAIAQTQGISCDEGISSIYATMDVEALLKNQSILKLANQIFSNIQMNKSVCYAYNEARFFQNPKDKEQLINRNYAWRNFETVYRTTLIKLLNEYGITTIQETYQPQGFLLTDIRVDPNFTLSEEDFNKISMFLADNALPFKYAAMIQAATVVLFYGRQIEYNAYMKR